MTSGPRPSMRAGWLLVRVAYRAGAVRATLVLVLAAVAGAASALVGLGLKLLVDGAAAGSSSAMLTAMGVLVGLVTVNGLIVVGASQLRMAIEQRVELLVDQDILRTCAGLPGLEHVEDPAVLDKMELLRDDRPLIASAWGAIVENLRGLVRLVTVVVLLASVNPWLLTLCVLAVPSLLASAAGERWSRRAEDDTAESERLARSLFTLLTTAAAAKEARVYGVSGSLADRHQRTLSGVWRVRQRADSRSIAARYGGQVLFVLGTLGAGALALADAAAGRASAGDVALVMTLTGQLSGAISGTVHLSSWLRTALRGAGRYVWLTEYAAAAASARGSGGTAPGRPGELVFERVSFSYPGARAPALRDVSIRVPVGATVAIVGENGAGKSTLVKLLCGFYQPSAGRITLDGADLADVPVDQWRRRVSACFQDFARFEFWLRETVGVGDLPRADDPVAVAAALDRADALSIPAGLPDGLETQLGRTFDGVDLSGGQWQKVALARASMRRAPDLLVLDEPAASLDPGTEYALIDGYTRAAAGRSVTTVLVSHRLSAVGMADLIVVLDRGGVIESGTHDELIAAGGRYAELYELQASRYR